MSTGQLAEQGLQMGIGTSLALAISYIAGFVKSGWVPSAVGNVVRYDETLSRKRAWPRFYGTLDGAAAVAFATNPTVVVLIGSVFAVLNGAVQENEARDDAFVLYRDHPVAVQRERLDVRQRKRPHPGLLQRRRGTGSAAVTGWCRRTVRPGTIAQTRSRSARAGRL